MGAFASKAPADVDLLPPRFNSSSVTAFDSCAQSPLLTEFSNASRFRLFHEYFASPGLAFNALLRPDTASSTFLTASLSGLGALSGTPPFHLQANSAAAVLPNVQAKGSAGLNGGGDVVALGSVALGAQDAPLPPTSLFVRAQHRGSTSSDSFFHHRLEGPGAPYTALPPSHPPSPAPAQPTAAFDSEFGARFTSASSSWSTGGALGAGSPFPLRLWATGQYGTDGRIAAGVEVSGGIDAYISRLKAAAGGAAGASDAAGSAPASSAMPLALGAALSFSSKNPTYELSLGVDGAKGEATAGYSHSMVVRRSVWNPLEAAHVKGIYQYVDIGLEARRALKPPYASALGLVGAWQCNRHLLLKARLGTKDSAVSLAVRSWTEPCVTLCLTASTMGTGSSAGGTFSGALGSLALGLSLSLNQGGSAKEYTEERMLGAQQSPTPTRVLHAKPELNMVRAQF